MNRELNNIYRFLATGYLIQYRLQDDKTKQFFYEYELLDEKNVDLATEVHSRQNRKSKEEKSHNPKKDGMDKRSKAIPTKKEDMGNRYTGQWGIYNNIDINNTNINNTNKTTTTNKTSSSTSSNNLITNFKENICKLKKTTLSKFKEYINNYDDEFITSVIEYCAEININSFAGFKKIINSYISKNIITKEEFILSIETYRNNKNFKSNTYKPEYKNNSFTAYDQRNYTKEQFNAIEQAIMPMVEDVDGEALLKEIIESRNK